MLPKSLLFLSAVPMSSRKYQLLFGRSSVSNCCRQLEVVKSLQAKEVKKSWKEMIIKIVAHWYDSYQHQKKKKIELVLIEVKN